jgi:hypothetical protein
MMGLDANRCPSSIGTKEASMSIHYSIVPKDLHDLSLAPVAVMIDRNLERLRDMDQTEIVGHLELMLDRPERTGSRDERAERIRETALRNVDCHGWRAEITVDNTRIRLIGGSVTLDLGLSANIMKFIDEGARRKSDAVAGSVRQVGGTLSDALSQTPVRRHVEAQA